MALIKSIDELKALKFDKIRVFMTIYHKPYWFAIKELHEQTIKGLIGFIGAFSDLSKEHAIKLSDVNRNNIILDLDFPLLEQE